MIAESFANVGTMFCPNLSNHYKIEDIGWVPIHFLVATDLYHFELLKIVTFIYNANF